MAGIRIVWGVLWIAAAAGMPPYEALAQERKDKPQDPKGHPRVDQKRVDEAIRKGVAYLKSCDPDEKTAELFLWTYLHAGLNVHDSHVSKLLEGMLRRELASTYRVSIQAMILEKLDRVGHQTRIFHCAQFLTDNQWDQGPCEGQWGYGKPTNLPDPPRGVPSTDRPKVASGSRSSGAVDFDQKQKNIRMRLPVARQPHQPGSRGDNSNSQYALLGMRACHDAGILFPAETLARAQKWWRSSQSTGERDDADGRPGVATGAGLLPPAGWSYSADGEVKRSRSGSRTMTVGGLGALCILDYIQGKDWRKDPEVLRAVNWVATNFVVENDGEANANNKNWHYYYLYGLERAGILYGTEFFGTHEWYPLGVNWLLKVQKPDGSWSGGGRTEGPIDTCFAILFLRRATEPIPPPVASTDRLAPKNR